MYLRKDNASLGVVVSLICIGRKLRRNERRHDPSSGVASVLTLLATAARRRRKQSKRVCPRPRLASRVYTPWRHYFRACAFEAEPVLESAKTLMGVRAGPHLESDTNARIAERIRRVPFFAAREDFQVPSILLSVGPSRLFNRLNSRLSLPSSLLVFVEIRARASEII